LKKNSKTTIGSCWFRIKNAEGDVIVLETVSKGIDLKSSVQILAIGSKKNIQEASFFISLSK